MRQLSELTDVDERAWPIPQEVFADSSVPVEVLPGDVEQGRACLMQLQVGAGSALGALALRCGGLVVDHGWLRVFAGAPSGATGLPGLARVNRFSFDAAWRPLHGLVVAARCAGRGGRSQRPRSGSLRPPRRTRADALLRAGLPGMGSAGDGLRNGAPWLLSGRLDQFYDGLRRPGRQSEAQSLGLSRGIAVYPFLRPQEAHADPASTTRTPVPMTELLGLSSEFCRQPGADGPGFLGSLPLEARA